MAKVLEGPGMGLLAKWGMAVPHYVVITEAAQLDNLALANPVVEGVASRRKGA